MKKELKIFVLIIVTLISSIATFGQGINSNQIRDGGVKKVDLNDDALRPVNSGTLPSGELTFDEDQKSYTKTVSADLPLTLAASGNLAFSRIYLTATGDGTHVITFPTTWRVTGTYVASSVNTLEMFYDGTYVFVTIRQGEDIIEVTLTLAEVTESTTNAINLTFSNAVNIDISGWSIGATDPVTILGVTGSGTAIPVFSISRDIIAGETVTISYAPASGNTASLTGNELETISAQSVTVPDPPQGDACPGCTIYFDDDAVDDIAAGTIGDPFKTIQAAVNAAVSGDIIGGRAGTYRETVVAKTNVTIRAYTGEDVFISGFNIVNTSWTLHSGNIYKTTITLPVTGFNTSTARVQAADPHYPGTTIMANQILRNGVMMPEARYPNIAVNGTVGTDDLFDRTKYRNGINYTNGFNITNLTDASFPIAANGLIGATLISNGWFMQESRTVTAHSGNLISWATAIWDNGATGSWSRYRFYITGKLALLDAQGEWHYEGGILYFNQPGNGTPTGSIVYKARNYGIDARGKQNVTIIGLKFIGCDAFMGDATSTGAVLDRIESTFANHYVRHDVIEWQGVGMCKQFGIKLLGANSIIKNSILSYSAGTSIWLGDGCDAENNLIHDVGYAGYWGNAISLWSTTGNQIVTRNTIYRTGRSGFDFGYNFGTATGASTNPTSFHYNVEVSYNDISYSCLISSDGGGSYTWGQCDLFGLNYHHNWIHDIKEREQPDGGINVGIYFDQATGSGKIHHNVTWNCPDGDLYHETTNDWRPVRAGQPPYLHPDSRLDIYNNTFWNTSVSSPTVSPASYRTYIATTLDVQRNNIYRIPMVVAWQVGNNGNTSNSILSTTNPLLVADNIATPQTYYQLQASSPARNIGLVSYAGVTGQISGHIDAGAYPYNSPNDAFIPGYNAPTPPVVGEGNIDDVSTSNTYTGSWTAYNNLAWMDAYHDRTIHVTSDVAARVSTQFTGDHIEWWSEKRTNHAIVQIWVDGVQQDSDAGTGGIQNYDLYDASTDNLPEMIFEKDVTQGNHTIEIRATGTRNASGTANPFFDEMIHDRFFFETN